MTDFRLHRLVYKKIYIYIYIYIYIVYIKKIVSVTLKSKNFSHVSINNRKTSNKQINNNFSLTSARNALRVRVREREGEKKENAGKKRDGPVRRSSLLLDMFTGRASI